MINYRIPVGAVAVCVMWWSSAACQPLPPEVDSYFEADHEGWIATGGQIAHHDDGGYENGYLEFEDTAADDGYLTAPVQYLGDLRGYVSGIFRFHLKTTHDNGGAMQSLWGRVEIHSGPSIATMDIVPQEQLAGWTTFIMELYPSLWGCEPLQWISLLSNVTEIRIYVDAQEGVLDRVGLDHVRMYPAEIPTESWSWGAVKGLYGR